MTPEEAARMANLIAGLRQIGERLTIALQTAAQGLATASAILDRADELLAEITGMGKLDA